MDDHYGNLDGSNWRIVLEFLRLGVTALGLTGPPCETFSAARYLPPPDGMRRPPRPLRSAKALWGIPDRIARELRQLAMGTRLLMHSQQAETMICLNGGMSAMERPKSRRREDCPDDAILPSSWDAYTQVHFLSHIPLCRFHQVEQWKYGADSVKPTTFRTIGMRNFAANLAKHADPHAVRPQMVLQGLNDKGAWKTAHAKEYPHLLCQALASAAAVCFGEPTACSPFELGSQFTSWSIEARWSNSVFTARISKAGRSRPGGSNSKPDGHKRPLERHERKKSRTKTGLLATDWRQTVGLDRFQLQTFCFGSLV